MSAPQWLIDRMEALRKRQQENPITIEQVKAQWAAAAKWRCEHAHCPRHKEYDMVKPPESNCAHCWAAYVDRHGTKESVQLYYEAMDKYDGLQT